MVSCGSQNEAPVARDGEPRVDPRRPGGTAVDALCGLGRDHRRGPRTHRHLGLEAVAAGHAPGGVEEHRLDRRIGQGPGWRMRDDPAWCSPAILDRPPTAWTEIRARPRARCSAGWAAGALYGPGKSETAEVVMIPVKVRCPPFMQA